MLENSVFILIKSFRNFSSHSNYKGILSVGLHLWLKIIQITENSVNTFHKKFLTGVMEITLTFLGQTNEYRKKTRNVISANICQTTVTFKIISDAFIYFKKLSKSSLCLIKTFAKLHQMLFILIKHYCLYTGYHI